MALTKISTAMWNSVPHHDTHDFNVDDVLYVDVSANNVGIGTTNPSFKLQVNGDFAAEDNIYLTDAGVVRGRFELNTFDRDDLDIVAVSLGSNIKFFTEYTERMRIDSSGNVGIGTSPNYRFNLSNSSTLTPVYQQFTNGTTGTTANDGTVMGIDSDGDFIINNLEAKEIKLYTSDSPRMTIDSSGNVGIGTDNPNAILDIAKSNSGEHLLRLWNQNSAGTGKAILRLANSGNNNLGSQIQFTDNTYYVGTITSDRTNGMQFYSGQQTSPTQSVRMVINTNGNVGIGVSPSTKLHVKGSAEILRIEDSSDTGNPFMTFFQNGTRRSLIQHIDSGDTLSLASEYGNIRFMTGTNGTEVERMRITSGGDVGIGVTSPTNVLQVSGDLNADNSAVWLGGGYVANSLYHYADAPVGISGRWGSSGDNGAGITLMSRNTSNSNWYHGYVSLKRDGNFYIGMNGLGTAPASDQVTLLRNGNVGIGETSPSYKLDVNGNVKLDYSLIGRGIRSANRGEFHLNSTGATDVAEMFFGYGSGYTDANIRWGISDRGSADDRLVFYKGPYHGGFTEMFTIKSTGEAQFGNSVWVNTNGSVNYNGYNENIRLFNAANGVSTIAFGASGASGQPTTSILGYSDRFETRYSQQWQTRVYNGYAQAYGSYRAPIFFDSDDTNYWADFTNGGIKAWRNSGYSGGISVADTGGYLTYRITTNNHAEGWGWSFTTNDITSGSGTKSFWVTYSGSNAYAAGSFRAPIFYDSNNTNWYVNPASTSTTDPSGKFAQYVQIGDSATYNSNDGTWGARLNVTDDVHARIDVAQDANSMRSTWYAHTGQTGPIFGSMTAHPMRMMYSGGEVGFWDSARVQHISSVRAPIFYDSDNTGFYVDPASTARLNEIYADDVTTTQRQASPRWDTAFYVLQAQHWYGDTSSQGMYLGESGNDVYIRGQLAIGGTAIQAGYALTMTGSIDMNASDINYVNQLHFNDNVRFYDDGNDQYLNFKWGDPGAGGIKFIDGDGTLHGYVFGDGAGGFGLLDKDGQWALYTNGASELQLRSNDNIEFIVYNSYTYSPGSSRAPIFYDSNDTGYYVDPASTTNFNALNATRIGVNPTGSSTSRYGISLYGGYNSGEPTYGLLFTGTSGFGTHGAVTGDWATYFTMNDSTTRGWIFRRVGTANVASISGGGTAHFNGDVVAYSSSDERLKDNKKNIENALEKVESLNGIEFDWNDKQDIYTGHDIGVIAQEVEKIAPEIVANREDGYKAVKYEKLVPLLIEAIKELSEKVKILENK